MKNIFFSWQSDLDTKTHRNYIEKCIKKAIKTLNKDEELRLYLEYDRDTMGILGSPDISNIIFEKIDKCTLFVADISNVASNSKRLIPNPNVLIELGYAINVLGWEKIICLFDINTGKVEELPFDIRQKRVLAYDFLQKDEEKRIVSILSENIVSLYSQGKLANPLVDYMKGKIDKCFLDISKKICNLVFETVSMSSGLADTTELLKMNSNEIKEKLGTIVFPAFVFMDQYETTGKELREILKDLFSSNYFGKDWTKTVLNLINWLRIHQNIVSLREYKKFVLDTDENISDKFAVVSGHAINPINPPNAKIVLEVIHKQGDSKKYIDPEQGKVVNTLECPTMPKTLERIYRINIDKAEYLSEHIYEFIRICNEWLELTDCEFILDPDYYQIGKF